MTRLVDDVDDENVLNGVDVADAVGDDDIRDDVDGNVVNNPDFVGDADVVVRHACLDHSYFVSDRTCNIYLFNCPESNLPTTSIH